MENIKIKIIIGAFILLSAVKAFSQEIIPNEFETVNLTYTRNNEIINENFDAPVATNQSLFVPSYIDKSPRDASRNLGNLPNFGIALFHHWLFGEVVLRNAQSHYALCVGELAAEQRRLKIKPNILTPGNTDYQLVRDILGYHVPFLAVQNGSDPNLPPKREDAIAHAFAAIDSVNTTVFYLGKCRSDLDKLIRRKR